MENFESILKSLKQREYKPIYFLSGEEPYYIDKIIEEIESNALSETEKAFNQLVLYGKETDFKSIVDSARQFPMMAERKIVLVKEAQELKDLDKLESYFKNPSPQTTLVFGYKYKKLDGRLKLTKLIKSNSVYLETRKLRDYEIPKWIQTQLQSMNLHAQNGVVDLLAEYLGADLSKIANELKKLTISLKEGETIDLKMIENKVGISKDYNVFELQRALGDRDHLKANRIANQMAANIRNNPLIYLNGSLFNYFSRVMITAANMNLPDQALYKKINIPYASFVKEYRRAARNYPMKQLKQIFQFLREADARSKGLNNRSVTEDELLKQLVFQILNVE